MRLLLQQYRSCYCVENSMEGGKEGMSQSYCGTLGERLGAGSREVALQMKECMNQEELKT